MLEGLKPYTTYKDTGSPWLGKVPTSWDVRNLRTLIRPRNERNKPELPLLSVAREKGVFVRSLTDLNENHNVIPEDLSNYKVAKTGNLVINKMKAWQGSMGIAPCDGIVSPAYYVYDLTFANRIYAQMLFRSKPYVAHFAQASDGVRVGQWDLTISCMKQIPVLIPPPEEQAAIVRYLDHANGRIDRAIRAKRKTIALLNEQKQVIIHRAVTRGLDPSVPFKASGISWLGDIPKHWDVLPSKALFKHRKEKALSEDEVLTASQAHGIISRKEFMATEGRRVMQVITGADILKHVEPNDFVMSMRSFQGGLEWSRVRGAISSAYVMLIPSANVHPPYFAYLLKSVAYIAALRRTSDLVRDGQALRYANFGQVPLPLVPLSEQKNIADSLDKSVSAIIKAISQLEREIELLREYRTRLISDVVTGKLDVREAVKNLPAETMAEPLEDIGEVEDEELEEAA